MNSSLFGAATQPLRTGEGAIGRVLAVQGSEATIGLPHASLNDPDEPAVTVGKFLGLQRGHSLLIGMITEVTIETPPLAREQGYHAAARVDLMG